LWAIIQSFKDKNIKLFFLPPLFEILMIYWHGGLYNIANGFFIMSFIYVLYLKFIKKEDIFTSSILLIFLIIPLIQISFILKIMLLILVSLLVFFAKNKIPQNISSILIWIVGGIYILVVGIPWVNNVLHSSYFTRAKINNDFGIKYFDVVNTVREAGKISFDTLVHRISGSYVGFFIGAIGYLILLVRYPVMIISLPMVFLGLFAVRGGLRFTIFAVPLFALGNAYVAYLVAKFISRTFINEKIALISKYLISFLIMIGFIYPNYEHIKVYIMPTTFDKNEVKVLDELKNIAKKGDYVLTWWDYGYPIRYYAKLNTLVDGGKHSGDVNWPVSFALTRSFLPSYNTSILDVYFTKQNKLDFVKALMQKYHIKLEEVEEFLSKKIDLPKIKEDIYYYLPYRMLNIFPTVAVFSSIDLKTGKTFNHFLYSSSNITQRGNIINIGAINLDLFKKLIIIGNRAIPIKRIAVTFYDKKGKLKKSIQKLNNIGLNVVFMKSYRRILVMDDFFYNSTYIQLFVFEKKNKLFKPVILTPIAKVYKVVK
jgi:dolichyl-diphosphooligosaccharide--protein glycosyltransferase/undecaprenyl-diphosphooligosaccharide--protein glycosyltransferase